MLSFRLLLPALGVVLLSSAPALAGFEWTPAPNTATAGTSASPAMPAVPPVTVEEADLAPVSTAVQNQPAPQRQKPMMSDQGMAAAPALPVTAPAPASPSVEVAAPPAETAFGAVDGFGADIPLVLALRQIVPPHYAFGFAPGVDQGARVTWNGGKPWNLVLDDALRPLGLGTQITETAVRVVPAAEAAAVLPAPPLEASMSAPPVMTDPALEAAPAASPATSPAVREVYIRRNDATTPVDDRQGSAGTEKGFWDRLGISTGKTADAVAPAAGVPAPLLTAPEQTAGGAVAQPVSLTGSAAQAAAPQALIETASRQGVLDPYDVRFWQAEQGDSLKNVLTTWSDGAGVELYWVAAEDYPLPAAVRLHGNYTDAVTQLLSSYGDMARRPQGRLHPNLPTGPSVLIIESVQN